MGRRWRTADRIATPSAERVPVGYLAPVSRYRLDPHDLDRLLERLQEGGRVLIGPRLRDGAIVLDRIRSTADLPRGLTTVTAPGRQHLLDRADDALFGYEVGPDAAKRWLHPPRVELWRARKDEGGELFFEGTDEPPKYAFIGLRACDLAAIGIQDAVFLRPGITDPTYAARRADVRIVAVQCGASAATCFCASMGTGPRVDRGADLTLTEVLDGEPHFVVEVGSEEGEALIEGLPVKPVASTAPEEAAARAAAHQERQMPGDVRASLLNALESPAWDDVAARCLACGNCTLVCPTCFCTTVEDTTTLAGDAVHARRWDTCFDQGFTDLHGHAVREGVAQRYRQWLTHKLSTWHDQFDTSGCVGCGRCITWCPAGIDLVEEARRIGGSG
ncbi:MAG: 4Fe-4S dicluster domain-containing protein [Alphaproteobacteria bacterium]|nr:4Fe-4S dicluster domain-containing protein [Alphaproteobacteria bacterium]